MYIYVYICIYTYIYIYICIYIYVNEWGYLEGCNINSLDSLFEIQWCKKGFASARTSPGSTVHSAFAHFLRPPWEMLLSKMCFCVTFKDSKVSLPNRMRVVRWLPMWLNVSGWPILKNHVLPVVKEQMRVRNTLRGQDQSVEEGWGPGFASYSEQSSGAWDSVLMPMFLRVHCFFWSSARFRGQSCDSRDWRPTDFSRRVRTALLRGTLFIVLILSTEVLRQS